MGFFDWIGNKANQVYDFFAGDKNEPQQEQAPVTITQAEFPRAPLTGAPQQETSLLDDISQGAKNLVEMPAFDAVSNVVSPQLGVTKNLVDWGQDFFFGKEQNTDKTQEQLDAKDKFNQLAEDVNKENNGGFFGSIGSFFGQRKISDSNYTAASVLSENNPEDVIAGEISPRVQNIFRAVDNAHASPVQGLELYGAMRSPISEGEAKQGAKNLAELVLRGDDKSLLLVAQYADNLEKAKQDGQDPELIQQYYGAVKENFGLSGVDDRVVKDVLTRAYKQKDEVRTNVYKISKRQDDMKNLYRVYDPQGYASYNTEQSVANNISKNKEQEFTNDILIGMEKSGLAFRGKDGVLVPKTGAGVKYLGEATDDFKKTQQTLATITQQRNAIFSFGAQKGIDMGENIANKNYEKILDNYKQLELIRLDIARGKEGISNKEMVRMVEQGVKDRGFKSVNSLLLNGVISSNGKDISWATEQLTPQDFLSKQAHDEDQWIRFNTKLTPANFMGILNNVGSSMLQYPAGIIGQQLSKENVISELDASDLSSQSDLNPTKGTQSIWDLGYNISSKIKGALPETASMGLNFAAINSASNSATASLGLIKGVKSGGVTTNIINSIGRVAVKSIPENLMQNALFHGVDSSGINTPDQLALDTIGGLLGVGFDFYGQAKGLIRYTKNKNAVDSLLRDRQAIASVTNEASLIREANPNLTDTEVINAAVSNVKKSGYDKQSSSLTLDEMKQFTKDMQNIKANSAASRASMSPQEIEQLNNIEKSGYARAKIWDDILSKETITDADMFRYNQIISSAGTNSVILSDLTRVVDKLLPGSRNKIIGMIDDFATNKTADNAVARLPFAFTNPQETSYLQKITQKLAPEATYSIDDLGDISKALQSKDANPLGLQQDLLEKSGDGYKYFRKIENGDYILNSEGFKKLGIIDKRGSTAIGEMAVGGEDFYKSVEENPIEGIDSATLDIMRKSKTYEYVKERVMDVVPC